MGPPAWAGGSATDLDPGGGGPPDGRPDWLLDPPALSSSPAVGISRRPPQLDGVGLAVLGPAPPGQRHAVTAVPDDPFHRDRLQPQGYARVRPLLDLLREPPPRVCPLVPGAVRAGHREPGVPSLAPHL